MLKFVRDSPDIHGMKHKVGDEKTSHVIISIEAHMDESIEILT